MPVEILLKSTYLLRIVCGFYCPSTPSRFHSSIRDGCDHNRRCFIIIWHNLVALAGAM